MDVIDRVSLLNLTLKTARDFQQKWLGDRAFGTSTALDAWYSTIALVFMCKDLGLLSELKTLLEANSLAA